MVVDKELFIAYIKKFFSDWKVRLSIVLNIIGVLGIFFTPSLIVIIVIVLVLSFFGIIYSGYTVYKELFDIIPSEYRLAYLPPKKGLPQIKISQIGGNEYKFGYRDYPHFHLHQSHTEGKVLPSLAGHFNLKVRNIGYIPIDILSIEGHINDTIDNLRHSFSMSVNSALSIDLTPLSYPITLEHKDELDFILYVTITPDSQKSDAQQAVSLREWNKSEKMDYISVDVNFADEWGKTYWTFEKFYFSNESIFDLYIGNFKLLDKNELLRLAGAE